MARILVVDDNPDFLDVARLILVSRGYSVSAAGSRGEGLALYHQVKPDLLLLDVMMAEPDDGLLLARELRRQGCERPIVMISIRGLAEQAFDWEPDLRPVDAFYEKPIAPATLLAVIERLLVR
jgi:CheY-like chemotaxis protein